MRDEMLTRSPERIPTVAEDNPLIRKLSSFTELSCEEKSAIREVTTRHVAFQPGEDIATRGQEIRGINLLLKGREPFVPFAPSVLAEDASKYWDGATDYPYMTFAVRASDYARREVPAVVHVDGTLRPQVVTDDMNPGYAELIRAFKRVTGIGVLLNTSFNRHGHPIVGSPDEAKIGRWSIGSKASICRFSASAASMSRIGVPASAVIVISAGL